MTVAPAVLLAWRMLQTRPRRTVILLLGYGLGVAVMVALLAVGDALLLQAQDKDVVSGGDVVVLPEGIDPEVVKVGGVTGMFLSIPNARYFVRQVLLGPRFAEAIVAGSPEIVDKLVYIRTPRGVQAGLARADVPTLAKRTRSALAIDNPAWTDTPEDRAWITPNLAEMLEENDRFHLPVQGAAGVSWAEWWYFNFTATDGLYGYLTFGVDRDRRAIVRVVVRLPSGRLVRWSEMRPASELPLEGASFRAGSQSVVLRDGTYYIHVSHGDFLGEFRVSPIPGLDFPPVERQAGTFQSGYVVPALRALVTGYVHAGAERAAIEGAGYHDHNWGLWQSVTWEWGTASNSTFALLAGLIHHPLVVGQDFFVSLYAANRDHPGVLATLHASLPVFDKWSDAPPKAGLHVRVPGRLRYRATNEAGDQLDVEMIVDEVIATPSAGVAFLQLRGRYRLTGRTGHRAINVEMPGFAETFVPLSSQR